MGTFKITQVRSAIGSTKRQRANLASLGLRKMNQSVIREANPIVKGMLDKVKHLVSVEEVK